MAHREGPLDADGGIREEALRPAITRLTSNDILMGRGAPIAYYRGNIKFRELVRPWKQAYSSAGSQQRKQEIARHVYEEVGRRNGRFLAKMKPAAAALQGVPAGEKAWFIVDDDVALEKIKQALREKDTVADASVPEASSETEDTARSPPRPLANPSVVMPMQGAGAAASATTRMDTQVQNAFDQLNSAHRTHALQQLLSARPSSGAAVLDRPCQATLLQQLGLYNSTQLVVGNNNSASLSPANAAFLSRLAGTNAATASNISTIGSSSGVGMAPAVAAASIPTASLLGNSALDFSTLFSQQRAVLSSPASLHQSNSLANPQDQLLMLYRQEQELIQQSRQLNIQQQLFQPQNAIRLPSTLLSPVGAVPQRSDIYNQASNMPSNQPVASIAAPAPSVPYSYELQQLLQQRALAQFQGSNSASRPAFSVATLAAPSLDPTRRMLLGTLSNATQNATTIGSPFAGSHTPYSMSRAATVNNNSNNTSLSESTLAALLRHSATSARGQPTATAGAASATAIAISRSSPVADHLDDATKPSNHAPPHNGASPSSSEKESGDDKSDHKPRARKRRRLQPSSVRSSPSSSASSDSSAKDHGKKSRSG